MSDLEVLGGLGESDALGVARHHPNSHKPLAERQLRILEDRPDLDGEPLAAIAALVGAVVRKVLNLGAAAVQAVSAVLPTNGPEMVGADLFVAERLHHAHQAVELLVHVANHPIMQIRSSTYTTDLVLDCGNNK